MRKSKKNKTSTPQSPLKVKNFKRTAFKLLKHMVKYKVRLFFVLVFAITSTIFSIVGPKILGTATTKLVEGIYYKMSGSGDIDFQAIEFILLILLSLYSFSAISNYVQNYIMNHISMDITYNLRKQISQKINRLPLSYFDTTSNGEILSRITNDVDTLSSTLTQSLTQMITSFLTIVGMLVMMFSINFKMTVISLCIMPISIATMIGIAKKSQKHFIAQQENLGHVNGHVEEMYGGHLIVKAFNHEENSIKSFNKYNDQLYKSAWKSQFLSGLMMPIIRFISNLGYVAVCIYGGYLSVNNGLPIGDIQAFIQYVRRFTQPMLALSNISAILQQTAAAAERVFEFLEESEEKPDPQNTEVIDQKNFKGNVKFENVHFGYSPEKIIIKNFSADIKPGQKVAIVGPTGAGKTTIVKLLMRFYEINSGKITIDGHNTKDLRKNDLRSVFGMVLQDTWLYKASILDNIRYGNLKATDDQIKNAAKAAQVDHFIKTFPEGYNTILNEENTNISQGQKQLLTIARAILANPKILILDEATSSVDTRTEILIQKAMKNLISGRTSFIIAHRLSTIKDSDLILVMQDGNIVEQGTHDYLMSLNKFYADLYNSQFEIALPL